MSAIPGTNIGNYAQFTSALNSGVAYFIKICEKDSILTLILASRPEIDTEIGLGQTFRR